jgi:hypothetical protein
VTVFTSQWKVETFRRFFTTRNDVYAFRKEINGKPGYIPIRGPLTDRVIMDHMRGQIMIGSYTPMPDGTAPWVAADFDGKDADAFEDARCLASLLRQCDIDPICNTSQSGRGVHVRVIFDKPVEAWFARRFMLTFIEEAGILGVNEGGSFDRCFPAADRLREGAKSIGNQIAAPLHFQRATEKHGTMLLDHQFGRVPLGEATWDYLDLYDFVTKPQLLRAISEIERAEEFLRIDAPGSPQEPKEDGEDESEREKLTAKGSLDDVLRSCELFEHVRQNPVMPYEIWFAIAANLKKFGEEGRTAYHEISSLDRSTDSRGNPRYSIEETNKKFDDAVANVSIYTCSRLAENIWKCPELGKDGQCNKFRNRRGRGPKAPASAVYFF